MSLIILDFAKTRILPILPRLLLSMLIGGILGLERGLKRRPAGFRTHMLVCMGATVVMLTSEFMAGKFALGDGMRLGAQVISGIGFLGAGTIMVTGHDHVKGLTTAASLWIAACMGIAVGIGFYEGAIFGFILVLLVLTLFSRFEKWLYKEAGRLDLYIVLHDVACIGPLMNRTIGLGIVILNLELARKNPDNTIEIRFHIKNIGIDKTDIIAMLCEYDGIRKIEEI